MKVALVVPNATAKVVVNAPPLNLGYLASYLRENSNAEIKIFDGILTENIEKKILDWNPDIAGITVTTPLAPDAYKLVDTIRENKIYTVMGGVHVSALPEEAIQHCNSVIVGEGEKAFLRLVKNHFSGVLRFRPDKKEIVYGKPIMKLDTIPSPAYDLMNMEVYLRTRDGPGYYYPYGLLYARTAPLISSRGCPFSCTFCRNSSRREPVRYHSAERIVDEIEYFLERYGVNSVFFLDDAFPANKKRVYRLGELLKEREITIPWGCQARTPMLTTDYLRYLKSIGCRFVSPGFESGNERMLKFLKRGYVTIKQNHTAIVNAEKVGMKIGGSFIFGSPTETREEMEDTVKFIMDHPQLVFIGINMLVPYPGTEIWDICREKGLLPIKVDYRKLVPTAKADRTYLLNGDENLRFYCRFALDVQRRTWLIGKVNLLCKMYKKPLLPFLKLLRLKTFWYNLFFHPRLVLKLVSRLLHRNG